MKIVMCTTPIRPVPTSYPPFGSMAIIQSLRRSGYDPYFYDIDGLRPTFEEVVGFFKEHQPDVVGVSAVVSTAYDYTKKLTMAIKQVCPSAKIVVGGNLAASAEILLRFCQVDVCGIAEGENVMVNLVKHWEQAGGKTDIAGLRQIMAIAFMDEQGEVEFTGYDVAIPATEFPQPDFTILEKYSKIEHFITDPMTRYDFAQDPRTHEPHRKGKMLASVITAKGCVARCTFCHRWDKGYRHWPVDQIISNIEHLVEHYNVGFIDFSDENFGSDRRKLDELIERLKGMDLLYKVAGVRCRTVDPEMLARLRDSGCVAMYYGMETGSDKMLDIMEKNAHLETNINAARWTYEAGMYTIYQLVLGMPGEDHKSIGETADFLSKITEFLPEPPHKRMSINFIQALPGTAVYEHARATGLIGSTLEAEEEYLIRISNIDAADDHRMLNFTPHDYFTVQSWRPRIIFQTETNWYRKRGWKRATEQAATSGPSIDDPESIEEEYSRGGYFNLGRQMVKSPMFYRVISTPPFYPVRLVYPALHVLLHNVRLLPPRKMIGYSMEFLLRKFIKRPGMKDRRSLRQVMKDQTPAPLTKSQKSMQPMRDGR